MNDTIDVLGVNISNLTAKQALSKALKLVKTDGLSMIFTPNPEIIMTAYKDKEFKEILNSSDMCTADGIGVVYASKILKTPVSERVAGFDLACGVLEGIKDSGEGVFLFGAKPGIAEKAKEKLEKRYKGLKVVGTNDGYFKAGDEPQIIEKINSSDAKLLLVCLGAPKQEKWIFENRDKLKVNLCMGVGGALDVFAGEAKRAPELFIRLNLEWFYRLLKQPSRIGRFMALPKFMLVVLSNRK